MAKMRAVQFGRANGPLEQVQREVPEAGAGMVRVKVQACGICHSDLMAQGGGPGLQFPRVPGHEVAGVIDAVGPGVIGWRVGQRVGVGWNGGYCGYCDSCRRANFFTCETIKRVTGINQDGGYADYLLTLRSALARIPDGLTPVEAAPLMCAGVTTFNALRNSGARPGDCVAVVGLGGLGHLAVQFAAKSGFQTVAIGRGEDKGDLAHKLGARYYVDNQKEDPAAQLQKLGGATAILATVTDAKAMEAVIGGLAPHGKLLVIGVGGMIQVEPYSALIQKDNALQGWYAGVSIDSQDTLNFSLANDVRSMNEVYPLEKAAEGYERMRTGKARFRAVLTME